MLRRNFGCLPVEIKQPIVLYLPINKNLSDVATIDSGFHYTLNNPKFARIHLQVQTRRDKDFVWPETHATFPFGYSAAALVLDSDFLLHWDYHSIPRFLEKLKVAFRDFNRYFSSSVTASLFIIAASSGDDAALELLAACGNSVGATSTEVIHGIPVAALSKLALPKYSLLPFCSFWEFADQILINQPDSALRLAIFLLSVNRIDLSIIVFRSALRYGRLEIVKFYLADSQVCPSDSNNFAIFIASQYGQTEIVKLLLKDCRVNQINLNNQAIIYAAKNGHTETVKILLADPRIDPGDSQDDAIRKASENGHTEIVKLLLRDFRVNPAVLNNSPLSLASNNGHTEIVKILLADCRVSWVNYKNRSIINAATYGHADIVKILLADSKVNPADENNSAILWASLSGHADVVKILLSDPRVDANDSETGNSLAVAAQRGHVSVVKLLLSDPQVDPTANNNSAIRYALKNEHREVLKLLLEDSRINFEDLGDRIETSSEY